MNLCHITDLKRKIEKTRKKMYEAYEKDPYNPEILIFSQKLDVLLNKYDKILNKTKKDKE